VVAAPFQYVCQLFKINPFVTWKCRLRAEFPPTIDTTIAFEPHWTADHRSELEAPPLLGCQAYCATGGIAEIVVRACRMIDPVAPGRSSASLRACNPCVQQSDYSRHIFGNVLWRSFQQVCLFARYRLVELSNPARGIPDHGSFRANITGHYASGTDRCAISNAYARQDYDGATYPHILPNVNGPAEL